MEHRKQWSPFLKDILAPDTGHGTTSNTWKNMLMYWSESSLGGILEVVLHGAGEAGFIGED